MSMKRVGSAVNDAAPPEKLPAEADAEALAALVDQKNTRAKNDSLAEGVVR